MNTMSSRLTTFLIRHRPALNEWAVGINEIKPNDLRFADECSSKGGPPGLVGAIGWCFRASAGKPSLLIIESRGQQYRLRFHSEPEEVAHWPDQAAHTCGTSRAG
jgi:hypothetical protein